jgi:hypothetical protein
MVSSMPKLGLLLLLAAAACGNQDNQIFGNTAPGATAGGSVWPIIEFDNLNSVIASQVGLFDVDGHPTGDQSWVIIMSDQGDLCNTLKANRDYFRRPPTFAYQAMILFLPVGRLGTFEIGRPGDEGTTAEMIGTVAPLPDAGTAQLTAPPARFVAVSNPLVLTFISLTNWDDGNSNGNFELVMADPNNAAADEFSGQYQAQACDGLDGTLLP